MRSTTLALLVIGLAGVATSMQDSPVQRYGPADPARLDHASATGAPLEAGLFDYNRLENR